MYNMMGNYYLTNEEEKYKVSIVSTNGGQIVFMIDKRQNFYNMFHNYCQRHCVCRRQMQFVVANNELNDNCRLTTILSWIDPKNIIKVFLKA